MCEIERMELQRMCGKLLKPIEMLQKRRDANRAEGLPVAELDLRLKEMTGVRDRLRAMADELPEGPLEAFGREHPLMEDPIDGPYCGYGAKEGKPHTCPVRDPAKHWDAWELRGTRHQRPPRAGGEVRW